jgi:hypothetical protein
MIDVKNNVCKDPCVNVIKVLQHEDLESVVAGVTSSISITGWGNGGSSSGARGGIVVHIPI